MDLSLSTNSISDNSRDFLETDSISDSSQDLPETNDISNNSQDILKLRRFYHSLARSLEGGTSTRPGLPVELVIRILRLADCILRLTVSSEGSCNAHAYSAETRRISWFSTPPLKWHGLPRGLSMQLFSTSRDQGWCNDPDAGSWSWFEIALVSTSGEGGARVKQRETDGSDLSWTSHSNTISSPHSCDLQGLVFDKDHELWQHVADGDAVEVRVCARFPGWQNYAEDGVLVFTEWFEPTLAPRPSTISP